VKATSPAYYGHQNHPPHNAYNGLLFEILHYLAGKETGRFSQNWIGVKKWCQNVQNILLYMYFCLRRGGPIILGALIPHHVNLLKNATLDYSGILCSKITMTLRVHISTDMKPTSLNRTSVGPVSP